MPEKETMEHTGRLDFSNGTALGAGTTALMGFGREEAKTAQSPGKWGKEADLVVVGYGGAGAVAAITASEKGGKVILLEKAPEAGGNTSTSGGGMRVPDNAEKATQYIKAVTLGSIEEAIAVAYAETWIEMVPWMERHGVPVVFREGYARWNFPGVDTFNKIAFMKSREGLASGKELFALLDNVVKKLGVEIMVNTPAKKLIQSSITKEILGVMAESSGKKIAIKAKKAVIMTCGGFEGNREMLATYIEGAPVPIYVSGTPYNTGDGIRMVMEIGADLWYMNGIEWATQGLKVPELPAAFWISPVDWSWINVNRYGRRFRNESDTYLHTKKHLEVFHFDKDKTEWPNHPWYMIFDEKTRKAGSIIMKERGPDRPPFITYNMSSGLYIPSPDNSKEIDKGWIKKADTITELATKTGIDQAGLQETIARYNKYCKSKNSSDPDFHKNLF